jgi:hypothetical protein
MAEGTDSNLNRPNPPSAPTSKRRRRRAIAAVIVLAVVSGFLIHALTTVKEPVYHGKRLSAWLDDRYQTNNGALPEALSPASVQAVQAIGTNALPYLLKVMRTHDSSLKMKLGGYIWRYLRIQIPTHSNDRKKAMYGFVALGPLAKPAFPELVNIALDSDYDAHAVHSLRNADADAIALLAKGLHSPDESIRRRAATLLVFVPSQPAIAVPALTGALNDPNPKVRVCAADALGYFGSEASSAIPALSALTNAADPALRNTAIEALENINTNTPTTPAGNK